MPASWIGTGGDRARRRLDRTWCRRRRQCGRDAQPAGFQRRGGHAGGRPAHTRRSCRARRRDPPAGRSWAWPLGGVARSSRPGSSRISFVALTRLGFSDTARNASPGPFLAFLGLFATGVAARTTRFWVLLGRTLPFRAVLGITLVRNLLVDLLPARLGELSYVYLVTTRGRRPARRRRRHAGDRVSSRSRRALAAGARGVADRWWRHAGAGVDRVDGERRACRQRHRRRGLAAAHFPQTRRVARPNRHGNVDRGRRPPRVFARSAQASNSARRNGVLVPALLLSLRRQALQVWQRVLSRDVAPGASWLHDGAARRASHLPRQRRRRGGRLASGSRSRGVRHVRGGLDVDTGGAWLPA